MRTVLLFQVIFTCWIVSKSEAQISDSLAVFHIQDATKDSFTVSLKGDDRIQCTFSYDTNRKTESTQTKPKQEVPSIEEMLDRLTKTYASKCLISAKAGWEYYVCLGSSIKQTNSETKNVEFSLGKFAGIKKLKNNETVQEFTGGSDCTPQPPRVSYIKFACGPNVAIASIEEPTICIYHIVVTVPEVCGHPAFQQTVFSPSLSSEQAWFLEITKYHDNTVGCSVRHSGYGKLDGISFESFELKFNQEVPVTHKARRENRIPLQSKEITPVAGGIAASGDFEHGLLFASISTKELIAR